MASAEDALAKRIGLAPTKTLHEFFGVVKSLADKEDITLLLKLRSARQGGYWYYKLAFNHDQFVRDGYGNEFDLQKDITTCLIMYEAAEVRAGNGQVGHESTVSFS